MENALIERYDLRVPRYTSYPTAPHFGPSVDGAVYAKWLGELKPETEVSLYLHIAYCAQMCWFCGCHTKATKRYAPVQRYMKALHAEVDLIAGRLPARMKLRHVHLGGGSPTVLKPKDLKHLFSHLRERFDVLADAEISIELDPRTTTIDYVKVMADVGVTRASVGVQDFDPLVQKTINRIQSAPLTARVIGWLRGYGIDAINMDLCYGLPHQTVTSLLETIDLALEMTPARIALFGYAHVPWMKRHMRLIPMDSLPDMRARWAQYEAAERHLTQAGYVAVGLDHFARPDDTLAEAATAGKLHRNFQGYTTDDAPVLIGLGASAIGSMPQGYVANEVAIERYISDVHEGVLPIKRGVAVTQDDCLRRAIIEQLMCRMEVDLDEVAARFGVSGDGFARELSALAGLETDQIVRRDGHRLFMTDAGKPLVRAVCAVFDSYLVSGQARHSTAV